MTAKDRKPQAPAPTALSVLETLRDALIEVARAKEYVPPDHLIRPDELHGRASGLAQALFKRYVAELKSKGVEEGQVLRLFEYSLLTGFSDAYDVLAGTLPEGVPDLVDMFSQEAPMPAVPEQVAFLLRKMPVSILLMNRFNEWMEANEAMAATVKVQLPDMLVYAAYWTYFIGVSRGYRIHGKW